MARKYKILRLTINNTLYRRYTNPNRKFTPRSIRTKYLNMRLDNRKRSYYTTTPHSVRCSRIYHIKGSYNLIGKVGKPDGDFRFDFSSLNANLLNVVSNSLTSKQIAAVNVRTNSNNGTVDLEYLYPFMQGDGAYGSNKLVTEISTLFYPGIYYSRGLWFWTQQMSRNLIQIQGYKDDYGNQTTDYTDSNEISYSLTSPEITSRKYFIFIPYTAIETPSIQAYLPLTDSINLTLYIRRLNEDRCAHYNFNIQWMGRKFDPTFITYNSILIYTGNYSASDSSQYVGTPSSVQSSLSLYLLEDLPTGYRPASSQWVILNTPSTEWDDSQRITPDNVLPLGYKLRESSSLIQSTPVIISDTDFSTFSCPTLKNVEAARLGLRVELVKADNPTIYVLVGLKIDYTPVTQEEQSEDGIIATNKYLNKKLADIVYANVVPINSGFHHLSRVDTSTLPEFLNNPNNPS